MSGQAVQEALVTAYHGGLQVLAHCNGDAAAEQFLQAVAAVEREFPDFRDLRPVMIHAQLLGLDEMEAVKRTGVLPSFFVAHVYRWGEVRIPQFRTGARTAYQSGARGAGAGDPVHIPPGHARAAAGHAGYRLVRGQPADGKRRRARRGPAYPCGGRAACGYSPRRLPVF